MDIREKLVELLSEKCMETCKQRKGYVCSVEECKRSKEKCCGFYADHLISNGITVQEWISVDERLPDNKEHDWVLAQVIEDNGYMHIPKVMEYRKSKNDWLDYTYGWLSNYNGFFTVTHWMPLPEPPKGE